MNQRIADYRSLAISERSELVEDIWDSIAQDTTEGVSLPPKERAELRRRLAAHHADPSTSVPWERVHESLFKGQP